MERRVAATLQGHQLSAREAEVVAGLAVGRSVAEVADALVISPRTVNKHLQGSYRKLKVTSRIAAATAAWRLAEDSIT